MNLLVLFVIGISLIILFIWHSKLYFHIAYSRFYSRNTIGVSVLLFDYITIYHKEVYILDKDILKNFLLKHRQEKKMDDHMKVKSYIKKNILSNPFMDAEKIRKSLIRINLKYLRCEKFSYYVHIGLLNPAVTALIYGVFFTFKALLLQYFYKKLMFVATPQGVFKLDFIDKKEAVRINCIFSLKIGNVIYMLKSLL